MEPPAKRPRVGQSPYDSDDDLDEDELSLTPGQLDAQQDPLYQLDKQRANATSKLKSRFELIFEKYGKDTESVSDEINFHTGEVVVNRGHLKSLQDVKDMEQDLLAEEEERILQGKASQSASKPKSVVRGSSTLYNGARMIQNTWVQPLGANRSGRVSGLATPTQVFGASNPFVFGSPVLGNNTIDPVWQTPEIRPSTVQNPFGFRSQPSEYSGQGVFGANSDLMGDLFVHQKQRRVTSVKDAGLKPLPAIGSTNETEKDEEEDDILLGASRNDITDSASVRSRANSDERNIVRATSVINPPVVDKGVSETFKAEKEPIRRAGRARRKISIEIILGTSKKVDSEPPKTSQDSAAIVLPASNKKTRLVKSSLTSESADSSIAEHKAPESIKQLMFTKVRKQDEALTNERAKSARRSSRSRKQTEFYGQVNWLKEQRRKQIHASTLALSIEFPSAAPDLPDGGPMRPDHTELQNTTETRTSNPMDLDENEVVESADSLESPMAAENSASTSTDSSPIQEILGLWKTIVAIDSTIDGDDLETIHEQNLISTTSGAADKATGLATELLRSSESNVQAHKPNNIKTEVASPEMFTRNQLDLSYAFSDDENDDWADKSRKPENANQQCSSGPLHIARTSEVKFSQAKSSQAKSSQAKSPEPKSPEAVALVDGVGNNDKAEEREHETQDGNGAVPHFETSSLVETEEPDFTCESGTCPVDSEFLVRAPTAADSPQDENLLARPSEGPRVLTSELPIRPPGKPKVPESRPTTPRDPSDSDALRTGSRGASSNSFQYSTRVSTPRTPRKYTTSPTEQRSIRLTSSVKKAALSSLVPVNADDEDEISILSSFQNSARFPSRSSPNLAASHSAVLTPRRNRKHGLITSPQSRASSRTNTPSNHLKPGQAATESKAVGAALKKRRASTLKYGSPLAYSVLSTPRRKEVDRPTGTLVKTPGGTTRRCGVDGVVCDRDFCFTCCM